MGAVYLCIKTIRQNRGLGSSQTISCCGGHASPFTAVDIHEAWPLTYFFSRDTADMRQRGLLEF